MLIALGASAGAEYRGWSVATPEGLFLMRVDYPPHDNPQVLCHPDSQHDDFGRPVLSTASGEQ